MKVELSLTERNATVNPTAHIDKRVKLSAGCVIGQNVQIHGKVSIDKNVWVDSNVIIYGPIDIDSGTYLGPNSILGFPERQELRNILLKRTLDPKLKNGKPTKIGKNVMIRSNCVVYSGVIIGDNVRFGHNVMVRENVKIGEDSTVGTNSVIDGSCKIGRKASIQTGVYVSTYTTVEDNVFLGPCCSLINDLYLAQKKYELKGPTIKNGASIGANSTIFPAITIGEGAVVGAGAVVREDVPSRVVVVGVPAKKLKDVPEDWHIQGSLS